MKPCWKELGATEAGATLADLALPELVALVADLGAKVVEMALKEAKFRVEELPQRTKRYQKQYLKENS